MQTRWREHETTTTMLRDDKAKAAAAAATGLVRCRVVDTEEDERDSEI